MKKFSSMSNIFRYPFLFLAACFCAPELCAEQATKLHRLVYQFRAGEVIRWDVKHEFQLETSLQGVEERAEGRADSLKLWKVESTATDGSATLVHSVPKASMWQTTTGQPEVRFDSETGGTPPPLFESFAKCLGKPLARIRVDACGNLLEREDFQQASREAQESDALIVPFPKEPIATGHIWNVRREVKVTTHRGESTTVTVRRRFMLREVADGRAYITIETNVLSPVSDPTVKSQLLRDLAQGEVVFDVAAGRLVERRLELDGEAIAFSGPASRMRYRGRFTEHLERPEVLQAARALADEPARR